MLLFVAGLFPLVWVSTIAIAITWRQIERPSLTLWRTLRRKRHWLFRGILFSAMLLLFAKSFSSFKVSISRVNPFWADGWLIELDRATFGVDPWLITHAVFGDMGTIIIDRIYIFWFFFMFMTLGWFCYTSNTKLQIRGLMTYLLSWGLLGGVAAVAFSSVGPCFYEQFYGNARFAPLLTKLSAIHTETPLFAARSMQYLIKAHAIGADKFGSGISAMPSMHVAIGMLSFLAVLSYSRSLWMKIAAGIYAFAIFVGSVHLGWHYAWDGIFSIIGVSLIWYATGRFVDWVEAREQTQAAPVPSLNSLPATA